MAPYETESNVIGKKLTRGSPTVVRPRADDALPRPSTRRPLDLRAWSRETPVMTIDTVIPERKCRAPNICYGMVERASGLWADAGAPYTAGRPITTVRESYDAQ